MTSTVVATPPKFGISIVFDDHQPGSKFAGASELSTIRHQMFAEKI